MTQHTAGPWKATNLNDICAPEVIGPNGIYVAMIREAYHTNEESIANAHLIAASPRLFEALKRIIDDLPTKRDWLDPVVETFAKDAILAATGQL